MNNILDKFLNFYTLIGINLIIVLMAELTDAGKYFNDTAYIHLIAVIFIFLAAYRIFTKYPLYFKGFLYLTLAALAYLSSAHIVEYVGEKFLNLTEFATGMFVVSSYTVGFLLMILGIKFIDKIYSHRDDHASDVVVITSGVIVFSALSVYVLASNAAVNYMNLIILVLVISNIIFGIAASLRFIEISKTLPLLKDFAYLMTTSFVLIIASGLLEYLEIYAQTGDYLSIQITYFSHFALFAALSIIILGFGKLQNLSKQK